jgi:hypothetical protein
MTKADILKEIPKLTREERDEIRVALAEFDADGWNDTDDPLSPDEKALIEQRLREHESAPSP